MSSLSPEEPPSDFSLEVTEEYYDQEFGGVDLDPPEVEDIYAERCHHYLLREDALIDLLRSADEGRGSDRLMMDIWEVAAVVDLDQAEDKVADIGPEEVTIYVQDWMKEAS